MTQEEVSRQWSELSWIIGVKERKVDRSIAAGGNGNSLHVYFSLELQPAIGG